MTEIFIEYSGIISILNVMDSYATGGVAVIISEKLIYEFCSYNMETADMVKVTCTIDSQNFIFMFL